jgi:DNA replication factor GINS
LYNELYDAWKLEKENVELQLLSEDFYTKLASYIKRIREETRMMDQKTTKGQLLQRELNNAKKMIKDIVKLRYEKALRLAIAGKALPKEVLAEEERKYEEILPSVELYHDFLKNILRGSFEDISSHNTGREEKPKKMLVRFLQGTPVLIGSDMKEYGSFKPEDIATLPAENARILIQQKVAVKIEAKY